jgi:phosphoheptose isomerase
MNKIDLSKVKTYPIAQRVNLVTLQKLIKLQESPPNFKCADLEKVVDHIVTARKNDRPVIWMMGAHVIKSGLSRIIIDLLHRGVITHVAGNGAVSIHDFELALIGETSEDVASSLEDGSFGMVQETGALMHQALKKGVCDGYGYGAAIGRFMVAHPAIFPHREFSILYHAYKLNVPATIHVTIGADIIHQHPNCNFTVIGTASGQDFLRFTASVSQLDGGVFLNFGSAVTGPEVFLKSLTIARNLGHPAARITTANFDLLPVDDIDSPKDYGDPLYYYRPRKNIVIRPNSLDGQGYHITGDHRVTISNLYHQVVSSVESESEPESTLTQYCLAIQDRIQSIANDLLSRQPGLSSVIPYLLQAFNVISQCFQAGGTLFLCGNGGSMSDALHISGELLKSYNHRRALPDHIYQALNRQPDGELLVRNLESGLRAIVLGTNISLSTAVANDMVDRDMGFAQELLTLAKPGDVALCISTSGNARSVLYTAQTARAIGLSVISLTGASGGKLVNHADITMRMPATRADRVQEYHVLCYHALCEMLEEHFFSTEGTTT